MIVTVTETVDGVSVAGSGVAITVYEGVAGDASGTAAAAVAAHVADTTDAHAIAGITGLQAALDAKAATTVTDDHETRIDAIEAGGGGAVDSVNGATGVVVLDATDVGADATGTAAAAVTAHEAAANPHPGYLTQAEADALYSPAGSGGAVDSVNGQTGVVVLDADDIADGTVNHAFTAADDTKLAGIAAGATANATDAQLRDRSTHTGTQAAATISDLSEAVDDRVNALLVAGTNITKTYDDAAGTLTLAAAGGGGGTTVNDRRWVRGSTAHAEDDEFNDGSQHADWARVDEGSSASAATWTEAADSMSLLLTGGDSTAELHALMRPYALAVGEAVQCHITDAGQSFNYPFAGLIVADGTTYGSGQQTLFTRWANVGNSPNLQDAYWTGYNTRSTFTDRSDPGFIFARHMRIMRDASNVWRFSFSPDGVSWIELGTRTIAMTPTHIGMCGGTWTGSGKRVFSFDYFRVVTP